MFDRRADCRPDVIGGLDEVWLRRRCFCLDSHAAAPQKIDALIVCNAKDPWGERTAVVPGLKAAVGPKKGVLHHVFAVRDRAGHPGAVTVKPRPKGADGFQKCEISSFELSSVFHSPLAFCAAWSQPSSRRRQSRRLPPREPSPEPTARPVSLERRPVDYTRCRGSSRVTSVRL